jgi:hypothetical protein
MSHHTSQFGLMVAYIVPGFVGLGGLVPILPIVGQWLEPVAQGELGLAPTAYALIGATAVGMIVSCVRWLLIDHLLHASGVKPPAWRTEQLAENMEAVVFVLENHYRYYQFYANTLVAIVWAYLVNRLSGHAALLGPGTDLGVALLSLVLLAGSRDALSKYYRRIEQLVSRPAEKG